ncbi:MAG: SRPBCC domain-containing protein [Rhodocyclales bacterium]|nr:SRPBCC domain-containing protein [Rhodocyclales bacterium]
MTTFSTKRQLAATPTAVFAAIKDPARLARWWGPAGFANRFEVFEFQVGGNWVFSMIGPDGTTYPNASVFSGIEIDRRVVIRHLSQPHFQLAITLEPSSGGTLLFWAQTFSDPTVAASVRHIVEPANEQNLDRLSIELGHGSGSAV